MSFMCHFCDQYEHNDHGDDSYVMYHVDHDNDNCDHDENDVRNVTNHMTIMKMVSQMSKNMILLSSRSCFSSLFLTLPRSDTPIDPHFRASSVKSCFFAMLDIKNLWFDMWKLKKREILKMFVTVFSCVFMSSTSVETPVEMVKNDVRHVKNT